MEVGSWADWVSALSTFGTLGIAFAAYKKAPDWLQPKVDEDVYKITKDLLLFKYNDLTEILSDSFNIIQYYIQYPYGEQRYTYDEIIRYYANFNSSNDQRKKIKAASIHIKKLGYELETQFLTYHEELLKTTGELIPLHKECWMQVIKRVKEESVDYDYMRFKNEKIEELNIKLESTINNINSYGNSIMTYVKLKK
ncbi:MULTISPECIES: hypothetical protein [Pectobacterium]|nr:hypothetical protein [Pectobacterium carotovorum]MBG0750338.1 hypothetical protein [Pectobacterium carotovorum subsp. carotovorum PCCS1]